MRQSELAATGFTAFVICFLVVLGVVFSNRPSPRDANADKSNQQQPTPYTHQPQLGTESAPLVIAVVDSPTAKVGSGQTKYWADNKPSEWWMIGVAILAVVVAAIQARFFWTQLKLMKDTLNEAAKNAQGAVDAAEATKLAVINAERTAERELRAYLQVWPQHIHSFDENHRPGAKLMVTNFGQTPALNVRVRLDLFALPYPIGADFPVPEIKNGWAPAYDLFPNVTVPDEKKLLTSQPASSMFTATQIDGIRKRSLVIYCVGEIVYDDIFGKIPRTSRVCIGVGADDSTLNALTSRTSGFLNLQYIVAPVGNRTT